MNNKQTLWKTYGILMGIMLGGALLILGTQAVWNEIQAEKARQQVEQARQATLEEETYGRYTELLNKLSVRNNFTLPVSDRSSDIQKAKQYCSDISADKANLKQDWGSISKAVSATPRLKPTQAILLSQIQIYCPNNLTKMPKNAQEVLTTLDNITEERVGVARNQEVAEGQQPQGREDFNAEIFSPPSNCRTGPSTNNSIQQALQRGDVLVDRDQPMSDSRGELWYREKYLGCWIHSSQVRFK